MHQFTLRELGCSCRFFTIFDKGDDFCDFLFTFLYKVPFWKGAHYKSKEFAQILSF